MHGFIVRPVLVAAIATLATTSVSLPVLASDAAKLEFFEKKVRPILVEHCYTCHSAETKPSGGLRVDDRNGLLTGGNSGAAIVAGEPGQGFLIERLTTAEGKRRMPQESEPLREEQIADLRKWIADGAVWPAEKVVEMPRELRAEFEQLRRKHWAWQPLTDPKVPKVQETSWPQSDIDRFLLARLEAEHLAPVADADKRALIRRVAFDLTGLPPTPAEIESFVADRSPDAYARLVERLLAAPQFGEHWGRHWLDVARYGESTGPSRNIPYPFAWRYRDYVIDAINADIPFDRFLTEQIAGDLLPAASHAERNRLLSATGFLALGVKDVNQRFKVRFIMDNADEQIDVVCRSVLALTVSCARCHDHKFDPITSHDYYALAGIFTSTDDCAGVRNKMGGGGLDYYDPSMLLTLAGDIPAPPQEQVEKLTAEVKVAREAWERIKGTPEGLEKGPNGLPKQRPFRLKFEKLQAELLALSDPSARGYALHGVREAKQIGDTEIRIRGEAERLGPKVPRGFPKLVSVADAPAIPADHSGRLELARWLTSPKNPLTPRVIANRVWHYLFGQGIVTTVDNFGVNGDTPSHPELLDHLASQFIRDGWSTKKLVRTIVLSRAYRLGSDAAEAQQTADPANRLVWRHLPRRLDAEQIRDTILAAAGTLDANRPQGSPVKALKMIELRDNGPEAEKIRQAADSSVQRGVYLPLMRSVTPRSLEAFDPVEQTLVTGRRDATTVPSQALYLLNSTFVRRQSLALAERLLATDESNAERIATAWQRILGRSPTPEEIRRVEAFLAAYESDYRAQPAPAPVKRVELASATDTSATSKSTAAPIVDPDQADQGGVAVVEAEVRPPDARSAAWLAFIQSLFGTAEFRYVN